jgi:hypothetical protein
MLVHSVGKKALSGFELLFDLQGSPQLAVYLGILESGYLSRVDEFNDSTIVVFRSDGFITSDFA